MEAVKQETLNHEQGISTVGERIRSNIPQMTRTLWLLYTMVVLGAFLLRAIEPGIYHLWLDEVRQQVGATLLGQGGQWTWVGNTSFFGALSHHSPFATYFYALPFAISPDPQLARIWIALWGTLAVVIMMIAVRRYYGDEAALIAGVFLAVSPRMFHWSRFIYNPSVAMPFIALWLLAALIGYSEGKSRWQIVHWLAFSAALQSQAALMLLLPFNLLVLTWYALVNRTQWRQTLITTLLALGLFALTLIPWGIGLANAPDYTRGSSSIGFQFPDLNAVWYQWSRLVGSVNQFTAFLRLEPQDWYPIHQVVNQIFFGLTWLITVGVIGLLWRGLRQYPRRMPDLAFAIGATFPLGIYILNTGSHNIEPFYFMSVTVIGVPIIGIMLSTVWQQWVRLRPLIIGLVIIVAGLQAWVNVAFLHWLDTTGNITGSIPLKDTQTQIETWQEEGTVVYYNQTFEGDNIYENEERLGTFTVLSYQFEGLRVVLQSDSIPVTADGSVIVAPYAADLPASLNDTQGALMYWDEPRYQWQTLTASDLQPEAVPIGTNSFGVMNILGVRNFTVERGAEVHGELIWQPTIAPADAQYQFSLRLVDAEGNGYTQVDMSSLRPDLWRLDDVALRPFVMQIPSHVPEDADLLLDVVVYTHPDIIALPVLDEDGNEVDWRVQIDLVD